MAFYSFSTYFLKTHQVRFFLQIYKKSWQHTLFYRKYKYGIFLTPSCRNLSIFSLLFLEYFEMWAKTVKLQKNTILRNRGILQEANVIFTVYMASKLPENVSFLQDFLTVQVGALHIHSVWTEFCLFTWSQAL